MAVAFGIMGRRGENALFGEFLGEAGVAGSSDELLEDALDGWRGDGVGFEAVQALTDAGFLGVGVFAGVSELVAVGRPAAEEAAFLGLDLHGSTDSGSDPVAFTLAHPAEQGHHKIVSFGVGIDRSADLRDPQLDAVVNEQREREPELVTTERPVRLANHDPVEAAPRICQRLE